MGYWGWKPYVPVALRRERAQKAARKAIAAGKGHEPVVVQGRSIARSFWGKAWCDNLEAYSDHANRLPRGRSYVRNGSVIDLKIAPGKVIAQVMGSTLYQTEISIAPVPAARWQALVQECTGSIATLVELLQGRFSAPVMQRICAPKTGLFPAPGEIKLGCSCPDWASMCKHVAAVLYGVGARLDEKPDLLFVLRQVDANDLLSAQAVEIPKAKKAPAKARVLDESALADVFGIELATSAVPTVTPVGGEDAPPPKTSGKAAATPGRKKSATKGAATDVKPSRSRISSKPSANTRARTNAGAGTKPSAKARKIATAKAVRKTIVKTAARPTKI